jgi:hypothetical protein
MQNSLIKLLRKVYNRLFYKPVIDKDSYFGMPVISNKEGNDLLLKALLKGEPYMASRFGTELYCVGNYLEQKELVNAGFLKRIVLAIKGYDPFYREHVRNTVSVNSGFFPTDDKSLDKFSEVYIRDIKQIDFLGVWQFIKKEDVYHHQFCPRAVLSIASSLESYYFDNPWTKALEGKRVLVVHPFSKTIESQFHQNRERLFKDKNVLPDFTLITIKAVQSLANNPTGYASWFDALEDMRQQIDKIDFDIALLGCGAYGLPLAAFIKGKGKIALHMGGSVQILFGIKGKRWDEHDAINKFYNEYWVRPSPEDMFQTLNKVEDGCYW